MSIRNEFYHLLDKYHIIVGNLLAPYRLPIYIIAGLLVITISVLLFRRPKRHVPPDCFFVMVIIMWFSSLYDHLAWGLDVSQIILESWLPAAACLIFYRASQGKKGWLNALFFVLFTAGLAAYVYLFVLIHMIPTSAIFGYGDGIEYHEVSLLRDLSWAFAGSLLSYVAARFRPCLLALTAPPPLFYFVVLLRDIYLFPWGRLATGTADNFYILRTYILTITIIASIAFGLFQYRNRRWIRDTEER